MLTIIVIIINYAVNSFQEVAILDRNGLFLNKIGCDSPQNKLFCFYLQIKDIFEQKHHESFVFCSDSCCAPIFNDGYAL